MKVEIPGVMSAGTEESPPNKPRSVKKDGLITSAFVALVVALGGTVGGQFAIDWIRDGVKASGLAGFWLPLLLTGLLLLAIGTALWFLAMSLVRRSWRNATWVRLGKWLWTSRPVSAARLASTIQAVDSRQMESDRILARGIDDATSPTIPALPSP